MKRITLTKIANAASLTRERLEDAEVFMDPDLHRRHVQHLVDLEADLKREIGKAVAEEEARRLPTGPGN